jgi:hypothetical protein
MVNIAVYNDSGEEDILWRFFSFLWVHSNMALNIAGCFQATISRISWHKAPIKLHGTRASMLDSVASTVAGSRACAPALVVLLKLRISLACNSYNLAVNSLTLSCGPCLTTLSVVEL